MFCHEPSGSQTAQACFPADSLLAFELEEPLDGEDESDLNKPGLLDEPDYLARSTTKIRFTQKYYILFGLQSKCF